MKYAAMKFITNGDNITAFFTDDDVHQAQVLQGRSLNDCLKAIEEMLLLMQHRNGIVNYAEGGMVAKDVSADIKPRLEMIAAADSGRGWGQFS